MVNLTEKQREKIEDAGWIHASSIIEVQGNDEKHIKEALEKLVGRLKDEKKIEVVEANYTDIEKLENGIMAYSVELVYLVKDFGEMTKVALLYSPAFIEIHAPKEIKVPIGDAQNILADISNTVTSLAQAVFVQGSKLRHYEAKEAEK